MTNLIRKIKHFMYPDGQWLRDYELFALQAFYLSLSDNDKVKLIKQFELIDLSQRSENGKLLQLFDIMDDTRKSWSNDILIDNENTLVGHELSLTQDKKIISKFVIFVSNGAVAEIQFIKHPSNYQKKAIRACDVSVSLKDNKKLPSHLNFTYHKIISDEEQDILEQESFTTCD